jgi:hypothetical protein
MFWKRRVGKALDDMLGIVSISHENVNSLQEAVVHLSSAVVDLNELVKLQDTRIELLEEKIKNDGCNNT